MSLQEVEVLSREFLLAVRQAGCVSKSKRMAEVVKLALAHSGQPNDDGTIHKLFRGGVLTGLLAFRNGTFVLTQKGEKHIIT